MDTPSQQKNNYPVLQEFAHNALFSFMFGPLINGMSSAINRRGFVAGVKEVVTTARGWQCNAKLAAVVGVAATAFNALIGRRMTTAPADSPAIEPEVTVSSIPTASHTMREEARRQQPSTHAGIAR